MAIPSPTTCRSRPYSTRRACTATAWACSRGRRSSPRRRRTHSSSCARFSRARCPVTRGQPSTRPRPRWTRPPRRSSSRRLRCSSPSCSGPSMLTAALARSSRTERPLRHSDHTWRRTTRLGSSTSTRHGLSCPRSPAPDRRYANAPCSRSTSACPRPRPRAWRCPRWRQRPRRSRPCWRKRPCHLLSSQTPASPSSRTRLLRRR
mmetsp:Transcript_22270/g.60111  ORF Transcript_22270/g.60111 Transcript_22270/m.60111 type:complete len:205 (-) Transcript_22270:269-883(-)